MRLFALVLVALLVCCSGLFAAPPQFAVENKTTPTFTVVNKVTVPPCGCGCMETGDCRCRNCCERTADPNWTPAQSRPAKLRAPTRPAPVGWIDDNGTRHSYGTLTQSARPLNAVQPVRYVQQCQNGVCRLVPVYP